MLGTETGILEWFIKLESYEFIKLRVAGVVWLRARRYESLAERRIIDVK